MRPCGNCGHWDYEHRDVRTGSPCHVTYGVWSDWPMEPIGEWCDCPGYAQEVM